MVWFLKRNIKEGLWQKNIMLCFLKLTINEGQQQKTECPCFLKGLSGRVYGRKQKGFIEKEIRKGLLQKTLFCDWKKGY